MAATTARLRRLLNRRGGCAMLPGAFNGATARLIERAGFEALYISGAGLANATAGVPDIGLLSLGEVAQLARYITAAVRIPALLDADTGFGDIARAVRVLEQSNVAGIHLEDQTFPKRCGHLSGKTLITPRDMATKIRRAVKARRNRDFVIIARTDARAVEGFDAAVERARLYVEAGADAIFPEALTTRAEFANFAKALKIPLLANVTEFGRSPLLSADTLAKLGYRLAIFPMTAFRTSMKAAEGVLSDLSRFGTQRKWIGRMQTRQQLYDLLDYDPAKPWPITRGRRSQ